MRSRTAPRDARARWDTSRRRMMVLKVYVLTASGVFELIQGSVVTTASSLVTVVKPSPCSTRRRRRRRRLCCAFNAARASKCTCTRSSVARRSKSVVTRRRMCKCLDWFARKMFRPSTRRRAAVPCLEQMIDVFVLFSRARSTSNY